MIDPDLIASAELLQSLVSGGVVSVEAAQQHLGELPGGLYSSHISPLSVWGGVAVLTAKQVKEYQRRRGELQIVERLPNICLWTKAALMRLETSGYSITGAGVAAGGGERGRVYGLSSASASRLRVRLATIRRDVPFQFATLTYSDDYLPNVKDYSVWKKNLDTFGKAFLRAFPGGSFVWRLEFQDRKSGDNIGTVFPHFHLLVWGAASSDFRGWLSRTWNRVCKLGKDHLLAGTNVRDVKSLDGAAVSAYVSKYVAKKALKDGYEAQNRLTGRCWGIVGRVNLPIDTDPVMVRLDAWQAVELQRYARRYASRVSDFHGGGRSFGKGVRGGYRVKRLKNVLVRNPEFWLMRLDSMLDLEHGEVVRSRSGCIRHKVVKKEARITSGGVVPDLSSLFRNLGA